MDQQAVRVREAARTVRPGTETLDPQPQEEEVPEMDAGLYQLGMILRTIKMLVGTTLSWVRPWDHLA